jgi:hypothetical protein
MPECDGVLAVPLLARPTCVCGDMGADTLAWDDCDSSVWKLCMEASKSVLVMCVRMPGRTMRVLVKTVAHEQV